MPWRSSVPTGAVLSRGFDTLTLVAAAGLQKQLPGARRAQGEREDMEFWGTGSLSFQWARVGQGDGYTSPAAWSPQVSPVEVRTLRWTLPATLSLFWKQQLRVRRPFHVQGWPRRRPQPAWEEEPGLGPCEPGTQRGGSNVSGPLSQSGAAIVPSRVASASVETAWGTVQGLCMESRSTARGLPSTSSARRALESAPRAWPNTEQQTR